MDKKGELAQYILATKGEFDPAKQDAIIKEMANICPPATAAEKNLTTDLDKAYEVMLIQQGNQGGATSPAVTTAATTAAAPLMSAEQQRNIAKTLVAQREDMANVSANSSIEKLVLDKPSPKDIIKEGATGVLEKKTWDAFQEKITNGQYKVLADDGEAVDADKRIASTTNYEKLKKAAETGEPVLIYRGELSTKPIGYIFKKGTPNAVEQKATQITREDMTTFLTLEAQGYILSHGNAPGAKLRYIQAQADASNPGKQTQGRTVITDANKKAAIEAGLFEISREITPNTEKTTVKAADQIRVEVAGKFKKDNVTPLVRTIRLSLSAQLPTLARKPEFIDVFGTGERDSNAALDTPPTGKQAEKIAQAQQNAIAMLLQKAADPLQLANVANIADKLKAFETPAAQAPQVAL